MNELQVYQILEEGLSVFKGVFEEDNFIADFRQSLSDTIDKDRIIDYDGIDKLREALKPVNECLELLKKKPAEMSDDTKKRYLDEQESFEKTLKKIENVTSTDVSRSETDNYVELTLSVPDFDDLPMLFEKRTSKLTFETDYDSYFPFDKKEIERVLKETAEKHKNVTVENATTLVLSTKGVEPTEEEIKTLALAGIEGLIGLSPLRYDGLERKFHEKNIY